MTTGYILIAVIFILGGIIAAFGDRLGTKIGKARLRLFNLRPRQTAMMITVITGMLISALTLGILFSLSESLRRGIFELDDILQEQRRIQKELAQVKKQKTEVEKQLGRVKQEQSQAVSNLDAINLDFEESKQQLTKISAQAGKLRQELNNLLVQRKEQLAQLNQLKQQSQELQAQLQQREQQISQQDKILAEKEIRLQELEEQQEILQAQVQERDKSIATLDKAISTAETSIQVRTRRLEQLESQLKFVERNVAALEQSYQELREKKITIVKGQVLSSAVVRIIEPNAAKSAIDSLLRQANSNAVKATQFSGSKSTQGIVKITRSQVEQLISQIKDGEDYVVRILSAGNYVQGEKQVQVFADLALNKQVFPQGEEIATVSIDSKNVTRKEVQERLNWLLAVSKFRAQRAGILGDIEIGDNKIESIVDFVNKVTQSTEPVGEIKAIVTENTFTAGPLKIDFVVIRNGEIVFST
ncbi:DUF3084 domain-containing protein [Waterburya agarophytonicola K14]|uniref:DUF3084 domain-containing protein n=1 Tax=Waterburya agarophytonicola KI4 TaxID=2874699 RepID=A0A964BPX3_9CYAN|nr:DUF3084 domain-containing protein [Waterburya agarophytonicola]MCC0176692.1 DUF3084 domain-containing protein [Waterburya agarophytonicola KI4]